MDRLVLSLSFFVSLFGSAVALAQTPGTPVPVPAAGALGAQEKAAAAAAVQAKDTAQAKAAAESAQAKTTAADAATTGQKAGAAGAAKARAATTKRLDLNSATLDELKALPALAPVADKIVAARPFANKAQLVSKKILDKATYEQIKALVVARKAK